MVPDILHCSGASCVDAFTPASLALLCVRDSETALKTSERYLLELKQCRLKITFMSVGCLLPSVNSHYSGIVFGRLVLRRCM
jgi:hypothetical protein